MPQKRNLPMIGKCFDHLGGRIAPLLFDKLLDMNWIQLKEGKKTVYEATPEGIIKFKEIFNIEIINI